MDLIVATLLIVGALVGTWAATGVLLRLLRVRAILDYPNERSSHAAPTPRGGGLAVIGVTLACWAVAAAWGAVSGSAVWPLIGLAFGLAMVSWADDLRGLGALPRLAAQAAAVAVALAVLPLELSFIGVIDPVIVIGGVGLAWLWFVNLFNFMDGIDGLAATERPCWRRSLPPRPSDSWFGTGIPPNCSLAMSAACRWDIFSAGCCYCWPRTAIGRRR